MANKKTDKEVLPKVAEAITGKPQIMTVPVKPSSKFHEWLIKHKIKPSKHIFEIKPQRVVNIYRIAGRAVSLDVAGIAEDTDSVGMLMRTMAKNAEDIFYIVAAIIQNNHKEPKKRILDIVKRDFEMSDILTIVKIGVANYNIQDFLTSIAFISGISALKSEKPKASPQTNGG